MKAHLARSTASVHGPEHTIGFEFLGWRGVRAGDLKATWISRPFAKGAWELFDLAKDPGETKDLSAKRPAELKRLEKLWGEYASKVGVVMPEKLMGQK